MEFLPRAMRDARHCAGDTMMNKQTACIPHGCRSDGGGRQTSNWPLII